MTDDDALPDELVHAQREVARLFFGLPASHNFLLAGGTALLAMDYIHRRSHDVDLFVSEGGVANARDSFVTAATERGWDVRLVYDRETFCRLRVDVDGDEVLVELAVDSAPTREPVVTPIGPTYAPEELAGRKMLAPFGRAEARDFADVRTLAERFGEDVLLARAAEVDAGFDRHVLAEMMGAISRFDDDELPVDNPEDLRRFYIDWRSRLRD